MANGITTRDEMTTAAATTIMDMWNHMNVRLRRQSYPAFAAAVHGYPMPAEFWKCKSRLTDAALKLLPLGLLDLELALDDFTEDCTRYLPAGLRSLVLGDGSALTRASLKSMPKSMQVVKLAWNNDTSLKSMESEDMPTGLLDLELNGVRISWDADEPCCDIE